MWYDKGKLLSYNKVLNFLIGNRGGGKSYGFKKYSIDDFLKNGNQFVWVRRYDAELVGQKRSNDGVIKSFFDDIADMYPNHKLTTKGHTAYIDGKVAGYFVPLSTANKLKSKPFPLVTKIIFDEFLIGRGTYHYLTDEVNTLLEFIETVNRLRDRDNLICVCIGNAISFANPYFLYFNIPNFKGEFYIDKIRGIAVQMYKDAEFIEKKKATRFGQLVQGTAYGDYAIENNFLLDNDKFIDTRTPCSKFRFAIVYDGQTYGFWVDFTTGLIYANRKYDKTSKAIYTLRKDDHDVNLLLIKNIRGTFIDEAVYLFKNACMRFEDIVVKSKVYEILSYFVR